MGGESRILKITAIKESRVAGAARGSPRCLPGAHEASRASSRSQRPGSSSPGRRRRSRRAEGPLPLGPRTSATPARVFPSMAAPRRRRRAPSSPGQRPARPRLSVLSGPGEAAATAAAGTGRRAPARREAGEAGAGQGPEPRTGAASRTPASPLRPLRSLGAAARQRAGPCAGRRAPPPGRPGAFLRGGQAGAGLGCAGAARRGAGSSPQDPPPGKGRRGNREAWARLRPAPPRPAPNTGSRRLVAPGFPPSGAPGRGSE